MLCLLCVLLVDPASQRSTGLHQPWGGDCRAAAAGVGDTVCRQAAEAQRDWALCPGAFERLPVGAFDRARLTIGAYCVQGVSGGGGGGGVVVAAVTAVGWFALVAWFLL